MSDKLLEKFKDYTLVERLLGGRSNVSYCLIKDDKKYVLRINDKDSIFVKRANEIEALEVAEKLGITSKTYEINAEYKLSEYLEGSDLTNCEYDFNEVSQVLKTLHNSEGLFSDTFQILVRLTSYELRLEDIAPKYYKLKKFFMQNYATHEIILTKCHNDAQEGNFIKSKDKIYLIDYEFAANNDFYYDLCSFSTTFSKNILLLESYLERKPTKREIEHLALARMSICLMWYLVALIKHEQGLDEKLQIDFKKTANYFLGVAEELKETYFTESEMLEC